MFPSNWSFSLVIQVVSPEIIYIKVTLYGLDIFHISIIKKRHCEISFTEVPNTEPDNKEDIDTNIYLPVFVSPGELVHCVWHPATAATAGIVLS